MSYFLHLIKLVSPMRDRVHKPQTCRLYRDLTLETLKKILHRTTDVSRNGKRDDFRQIRDETNKRKKKCRYNEIMYLNFFFRNFFFVRSFTNLPEVVSFPDAKDISVRYKIFSSESNVKSPFNW